VKRGVHWRIEGKGKGGGEKGVKMKLKLWKQTLNTREHQFFGTTISIVDYQSKLLQPLH